jgi:hypothetical protein
MGQYSKSSRFLEYHQLSIRAIEKNSNWPISKYHLSHVGVVTFVNRSQRVPRFVKSGLALVCNVRLNGSIRWKDYNVFDLIFHTTAEALCFVKKLAKFFTTMFHLTSFYGNGGTKFPKIAERRLSLSSSSPARRGNTENRGRHQRWASLFAALQPCSTVTLQQ